MLERYSLRSGYRLVGTSAGLMAATLALAGAVMLSGCASASQNSSTDASGSTGEMVSQVESSGGASGSTDSSSAAAEITLSSAESAVKDGITVKETITNSEDGGHAIEADNTSASYSNVEVVKSGDSSGDEADFYGENASVFGTNGATLTLSDAIVSSNGAHANGVFSYGEGTTVNVSDSFIETTGNCSGGLMTTGGGTMNASNLTVHTAGNSSAAIRSDRGGGIVNVTGGSYTTDGTGSPVIYSTANITVSDATLVSTASQGVVVEGRNSVTLNNVELVADNNTKNSDKSDYYQAIMIYQSMSGDAAEGEASFTADGGSITNANGDIFFVNNTTATINLKDTSIVNQDADGVFLRAAAAGWGNEGSNGGHVALHTSNQSVDGNMLVDSVSSLNLYMADSSTFNGAINPDGQQGDVYVELSGGSKWVLTADSYISSLTCDSDSIDLNGHTLYVGGEAYESGTAQTGNPIEVEASASDSGHGGDMPSAGSSHGGPGGEKPSGEPPSDGKPGGESSSQESSGDGASSNSAS